MRIRYCPKCGRAGLKWNDDDGKGNDGLTDTQRYESHAFGERSNLDYSMRWCPRCREWVRANIGANIDQHKHR